MSWCSEITWQSPAGEVLLALITALPRDREYHITLFGSSPLQLAIEKAFSSANVDLFAGETHAEVVWNEIFGHDINVRQEIIAPAIRRRNAGYADDIPSEDHLGKIRELGEE